MGWRKKRYLCIDFIVSVPSQMHLTSPTLFEIFITESLSQAQLGLRAAGGAWHGITEMQVTQNPLTGGGGSYPQFQRASCHRVLPSNFLSFWLSLPKQPKRLPDDLSVSSLTQ